MDPCIEFFNLMPDLRQGKLEDGDQRRLFAHLAECGPCRELFDFHDDLSTVDVDPSLEDALAGMRASVLDQIQPQPVESRRFRGTPRTPVSSHAWMAAAAMILVALAAGFAAGRIGPSRSGVSEDDLLVAALERTADDHTRLVDVENSESVVSNVRVRPAAHGRVVMAFDVSRHLEVERPTDDPLVNEVLVHAMLDRSSLGSQLRAISMADTTTHPKIQEGLVFAMTNDPMLAVRIRALESISRGPLTAGVEEGLLHVLRHDESVQMRMLAIDLLAGNSGENPSIINQLLDEEPTLDPAVADRLMRISNT